MAAPADPAPGPRRRPDNQGVRRKTRGYRGPGSDQAELADDNPRQNDRTCPERRATLDHRRLEPLPIGIPVSDVRQARGPRVEVVGEDDARADEDAVLQVD